MSPSIDSRERRQFASELKFLVDRSLAAQIRSWACERLLPDPHVGGATGDTYTVNSLYCDTAGFDVYHRRGSFGRSKYRIRRYGKSETVFLERKLKTRAVLAKRRTAIPLASLSTLSGGKAPALAASWFYRRLCTRNLSPVIQISYERLARVAMTLHGPIRLTLDENLRAQRAREFWFEQTSGTHLLADQLILELKFRFVLPAVFKYLVEEFALLPRAFSKYRYATAALGFVPCDEVTRATTLYHEIA